MLNCWRKDKFRHNILLSHLSHNLAARFVHKLYRPFSLLIQGKCQLPQNEATETNCGCNVVTRWLGRDRFASSGTAISSAGSRISSLETIDQTETGTRWLTMFTFLRLQLKSYYKWSTQWRSQGARGPCPPPPNFWWIVFSRIRAKIYAISSDAHQLQFIKLHHFKHERV